MVEAAALRKQIEWALAERIPAALSFRHVIPPELLPCGVSEVDALLGGGLPLGAITEMTGAHSSGRTTLALATLAEATRQGESCAYVDVSDALNPFSAAALGVDLRRLLWIRAGESRTRNYRGDPRTVEVRARGGANVPASAPFPFARPAQALVSPDLGSGAGWRHPRDEAIGMHCAVGELFQTTHEECVDFTPRCSEAVRRERVRSMVFTSQTIEHQSIQHPGITNVRREDSRMQLDHALRATDLLLNTGGFRALVLDMGDVSPEQARRVPLATWYRFRLQVEKSRTLFLLMTRVPCANSCAAVSLHCQQGMIHWQQAALHSPGHSPSLLAGLDYRVKVARSRAVNPARKKPATSAQATWSSTPSWAR
jgi:recombination protein RecA